MLCTINKLAGSADVEPMIEGAHSERDIKLFVRTALASLSRLEYGWDGHFALPIRNDVVAWTAGNLVDPTVGVLGLFGVDLPTASLMASGVLVLWFDEGERQLELTIPCSNVLISRMYADGSTIEERLPQDREGLAESLSNLCHWLKTPGRFS